MFDSLDDQKIQEGLKYQSKYISIVIRNAMEDFHSKHLTDAQMKELNPLIRNAVYTALYSMQYSQDSLKIREFVSSQVEMIPKYWEEPELLKDVDK
jgi:transcription termination factor NusB